MTVLPIPLTRGAAATACTTVQPTASLFRRWRPAGLPVPGARSALTGFLKLQGLLVSFACVVVGRRDRPALKRIPGRGGREFQISDIGAET
jgi:hypothetical protein